MKSFIVVGLLVVAASVGYRWYAKRISVPSGIVIVLNGPSAAGKTSIQKVLQDLWPRPLLRLGIDTLFVGPLPERVYLNPRPGDEQVMKGEHTVDQQGNALFPLTVGPKGRKVVAGMHGSIAAYARAGNDVVVDYIAYESDWLPALLKACNGLRVVMVAVHVPLEILQEREKARGTSPIGHARSHYASVHQGVVYDLELRVTDQTPAQLAQEVMDFVAKSGS